MKLIPILVACTLGTMTNFAAHAADTPAMIDRTADLIKEYEAEGLVSLGTIRSDKQPVTMKFFVTQSAQKIMDEKTFDVPDDAFDEAKFETFVAQKFGNALVYLLERMPNWPASEINLILSDTGDERQKMTASVFHRSRVLEIDVRRWHKAWRQENFTIYETTPVHELTHVLQWFSDQNETRYQRELSANIVEVAYLHYRVGSKDPIFTTYLALSGPKPTREQLLDPDTNQAMAWRTLAYQLVNNCLDGTYRFTHLRTATENKKTVALEKFAILYARHPATGDAGFAAACRESGLLDSDQQALTLNTLRRDTARDWEAKNVIAK